MSQVSSGGKWTAAFETRLLKITKMSVLSLHLFGRWRFKRVDGPIGVEVKAWLLIIVRNICVCMIYHTAAAFNTRRLADTFLDMSSSLWSIHYLDPKFCVVWSKHDFQDWKSPLEAEPLLSPLLLGISKNDKIHMYRWLFKFFHVPPSLEVAQGELLNGMGRLGGDWSAPEDCASGQVCVATCTSGNPAWPKANQSFSHPT